MLDSSFAIECDPARDLIHVTVSGFFTTEAVEAFGRARDEPLRKLRCGPNQHVTLCDATGMRIQSQEVVAAFARVMQHPPRFASRRLAMVVGSSLVRHQLQRLAELANRQGPLRARVFGSSQEAEAWLFEADADFASASAA